MCMATTKKKPQGRVQKDYEIDRREFNGHVLVLLEDRSQAVRGEDGASGQYILAVEMRSKKSGKVYLEHSRYISDIVRRKGFSGAKEGARAMFMSPGDYKSVLGEHWFPFTSALV